MSAAYYNGVSMFDVLTEQIDNRPVYDQSGADMIAVRKTFTLLATVVAGQQTTAHGIAQGATFISSLAQAIDLLSVPRKRFRFEHAGDTLIDVQPGAVPPGGGVTAQRLASMDVENGPKPSVTVLGIPGTVSCRIRFTCECVVPVCGAESGAGRGGGVLNLRFWIGEDVDLSDWTTTRTYQGRIRLAHNHLNPHAFRGLTLPPVQPGFQPVAAHFQGSEDGLTLDFSLTFKELWAQAPSPATDWDGEHHVSSPMAGGAIGESEVNLSLKAPKNVPQTQLLGLAARILRNKLHFDDIRNGGTAFLLNAAFSASLKHNHVRASARVRHVGSYALVNVGVKDFGFPLRLPGYNKEVADPGSFTATTTGLFLSALQTACDPARMPQRQDAAAPQVSIEVLRRSDSQATTPYTPYDNEYSRGHQSNAYLEYKESNHYDFNEGLIHLPVSATSSPGSAPTSAVIDLFPAQAQRTVKITSTRLNAWPELPLPQAFSDDNGISHRVLRVNPTPHAVQLSADGVKTLQTVDFSITYALSRRPEPGEALSVGRIPLRGIVSNEAAKSKLPTASVYVPYSSRGGLV